MYTVNDNKINELIIEKSRFITIIYHLNNEDEVKCYLKEIKNEYKHATHYCYSYIIDNIKRFNDDGEPTGTAGMPILSVLEKHNLTSILCVVIRYFGGIKLGSGGLIRAYTNSVTEALKVSEIIKIIPTYIVTIKFTYNDIKRIEYLIKKIEIIDKDFTNDITYTLKITEDNINIIDILKEMNIVIKIDRYL